MEMTTAYFIDVTKTYIQLRV